MNPKNQQGKPVKKSKKLRVFVAGGARSGSDQAYLDEAYQLGKAIADIDFQLDFGLASSGIMGAVAKGVYDACPDMDEKSVPIQGITTKEYFNLYQRGNMIFNFDNIVVAKTLEERKKRLLRADFIVFAPGGLGTLDELAYDCVAMQDGFLPMKPFVIFNVNGYFHHLVEYLKDIQKKKFSDPVPFIVVDSSQDMTVVFEMLKYMYFQRKLAPKEVYPFIRGMIYELPYVLSEKEKNPRQTTRGILRRILKIKSSGTEAEQKHLSDEIERAYLSKEIARMYRRLAKSGTDIGRVSAKLEELKDRCQK